MPAQTSDISEWNVVIPTTVAAGGRPSATGTRGQGPRSHARVFRMEMSKSTARIDNIYFLSRIGSSLRWATQDISREELPANIKHLLARLDRLEARAKAKSEEPDNSPAS